MDYIDIVRKKHTSKMLLLVYFAFKFPDALFKSHLAKCEKNFTGAISKLRKSVKT